MPMIEPSTELDAVNEMLMSIGQAPVSTLAVTGINDVNTAKARLTTALRTILTRGWHFNTDEAHQLQPDADGFIAIPSGALSVDGSSKADDFAQRRNPVTSAMSLYNRAEQSFVFSAPVSLRIVWGFPFEDLPQVARTYIATCAGRRFQSKVIGSQILDRFEEEDEVKAYVDLVREDRSNRDANLFRGNAGMAGFGSRRY